MKRPVFYYDLQINEDGSEKKLLVNRGKGCEGWLPLWAKVADQEQADQVVEKMMDEECFNLTVPLPVTSKDNDMFEGRQVTGEDRYGWIRPCTASRV